MAGIYIHIPFCKSRCVYCDFYSSTQMDLKELYIHALCKELEMRQSYLQGAPVETIYFGGGTPSILNAGDFDRIFNTLSRIYGTTTCKEITLEANPEDLSADYLQTLSGFPFSRISIGIQTFDNGMLKRLNRRHDAAQAFVAVDNCCRAGFDNISIDLMYGLPEETVEMWMNDLLQALSLHPEHLSAYCLTYEKDTPIYEMLQKRQVKKTDEDTDLHFFVLLTDTLTKAGYEQYEISNFCRPGKHSQHNSAYWEGIPYMGCGASAHSYNGTSREWNVSSLASYLSGIQTNQRNFETEERDTNTCYNEFIITSVRTRRGLSLKRLEAVFGEEYLTYCLQMAQRYMKDGKLEKEGGYLRLTQKGIFVSDGIMIDLLRVKE
ncbi:Oxygen-independent coproporphyrinogen-III oxidase-like protein [termite gut metagenome]|uniref:Oxygen-independent coproporphyrinogen-III oxidase-like protein n=1 Tax=termite gut metagenome TaxID=433724 RepID=A0A5J4SBB5_9ZZZZ